MIEITEEQEKMRIDAKVKMEIQHNSVKQVLHEMDKMTFQMQLIKEEGESKKQELIHYT